MCTRTGFARGLAPFWRTLKGMDALVFTAGVGENRPRVREVVCGRFGFRGLQIDPDKNAVAHGDRDIAASGSRVRALVICAEEEWEIARVLPLGAIGFRDFQSEINVEDL